MGEKGKELIMLYISSKQRPINSLICLEREKLELVNRNIDKIDRLFSRCSKPLEFFDLANVINTITASAFEEQN